VPSPEADAPTPDAPASEETAPLSASTSPPSGAARPTAPRVLLPPAPQPPTARSYVLGLPTTPGAAGWLDEQLLWLGVPSRSQYDGTPYAASNCGPSALGMVLEAYGLWVSTAELRDYANSLQGTYRTDVGIALDYLAEIARRANLQPIGLYGPSGYRRWTIEDVRAAVRAGYPVIVLTTYRLLPGNSGYGSNVNHYIVISGLLGEDFLYNDSAFGGEGARGLLLPAAQLEAAWATADIPRHAVAFGLGEARYSLLDLAAARAPHPPTATDGPQASRLAPEEERTEPRERSAPAPDPSALTRYQLLEGPRPGASLLDTVLLGGSVAAPSALSIQDDSTQPAGDTEPPPLPRAESAAVLDSGLLLLGAVGSLYLLLLAHAALARLGRQLATHNRQPAGNRSPAGRSAPPLS